jgi:phosphoribosyl 1,2-cyclic phosphodiesterase
MINVTAIASGSNGNCYFFENENHAILIDAGISRKQILRRMENLGLEINKVRAIFVTHEHTDHTKGIDVLSRTQNILVFITEKTYANSNLKINDNLICFFKPEIELIISDIRIRPFLKNHDAAEPCSFIASSNGKNVGFITDIGSECNNVVSSLKNCDALFLESNYDETMLGEGSYPYFLKKRIASETGHFSNHQAGCLILENATPRLKHVFLSHLSGNNNTPKLAYNTFSGLVAQRNDLNINVTVSSREKESNLLQL